MKNEKSTLNKFVKNLGKGAAGVTGQWHIEKNVATTYRGDCSIRIQSVQVAQTVFPNSVPSAPVELSKPSQFEAFDIPIKVQNRIKKLTTIKYNFAVICQDGIAGTNGHKLLFIPTGCRSNPIDIPVHRCLLGLSQQFSLAIDAENGGVWYSNGDFDVCIHYQISCDRVNEVITALQKDLQNDADLVSLVIPNKPEVSQSDPDPMELIRLANVKNNKIGFYDWALVKEFAGQTVNFIEPYIPLHIPSTNGEFTIVMNVNTRDDLVTKLEN